MLARIFAGLTEPVVVMLGLALTVSYGALYYSYAVLAPAVIADLGIGLDAFYGILTIGLLGGGLASPVAGRLHARFGARPVMVTGAVIIAISLAFSAMAPTAILFSISTFVSQTAAVAVFYEAAFIGLVQIHGKSARPRMTSVTLIAGFASTIFWPLTHWLMTELGWRATLVVFAVAHLALVAPLCAYALRAARPERTVAKDSPPIPEEPLEVVHRGAARRRALILFTFSMVVSGFLYASIPVHMIAIIRSEGFTAHGAALLSMVLGPTQVLSRVIEIALGHRIDPRATGRIALVALLASMLILLASNGSLVAAVGFAVTYGIAQGLITLARGAIPLQLFGLVGYADLIGRITGLRSFLGAFAPFIFAFAVTRAGMDFALWLCAFAAMIALGALVMLSRPVHQSPPVTAIAPDAETL